MNKENTQVVIIGAGPSGSTAAALLHAQQIDVIVLEKAQFPRFSIGESLLPACMEVIEEAGMLQSVVDAGFQYKDGAAFRKNGVYTQFDFTDKFSSGPGTTFQVQRSHFDKVLADSAAEQGLKFAISMNYLISSSKMINHCCLLRIQRVSNIRLKQNMYLMRVDLVVCCQSYLNWKNLLVYHRVRLFLPILLIISIHFKSNMIGIKY